MTDGKKLLEELMAGLDGVTPIFLVSAMVEKPGAFGHRAAAWPANTKAEALGTCLSMWQVDGWSVVSHEVTECKTLVSIYDVDTLKARASASEARADKFKFFYDAIRKFPALPDPVVLKYLKGSFPDDWKRGKKMQGELGLDAIPPKTECEIGAGFWDRVTNGAWRSSLT